MTNAAAGRGPRRLQLHRYDYVVITGTGRVRCHLSAIVRAEGWAERIEERFGHSGQFKLERYRNHG